MNIFNWFKNSKQEAQNQIIEVQEKLRLAKIDAENQKNTTTKEEPDRLNKLKKTENLKTAEADNQEKSKITEIETPVNQNDPANKISPDPSNGHYLTSPVVRREASQKELREVNSEWGLLHAKMQNDSPLTKEELAELEPRLQEHQKELEEQRAFVPKERPFVKNDPKQDKEDLNAHQEPPQTVEQSSGSYEKPVTKDHIDVLREQIEQSKDKLWDDEIEFRELDYHYTEQHPDLSHWQLLNNHSDLSEAYYSYKDQEIQSQDWGYEADYYEDKLEAYSEDFKEDWNKAKGFDLPAPEGMEPDV